MVSWSRKPNTLGMPGNPGMFLRQNVFLGSRVLFGLMLCPSPRPSAYQIVRRYYWYLASISHSSNSSAYSKEETLFWGVAWRDVMAGRKTRISCAQGATGHRIDSFLRDSQPLAAFPGFPFHLGSSRELGLSVEVQIFRVVAHDREVQGWTTSFLLDLIIVVLSPCRSSKRFLLTEGKRDE